MKWLKRLRPRRTGPPAAQPPAGEVAAPKAEPGAYARASRRPENDPQHRYVAHRTLATLLFASTALNLGLGAGMLYLLPLQRVVPFLIQIKPHTEAVALVEPLIVSASTQKLLVEDRIRTYTQFRHEVIDNTQEMARRWRDDGNFIAHHSTAAVFAEFVRSSEETLGTMAKTPFRREVDIVAVSQPTAGLWHVEFTTSTRLVGTHISDATTRRWVAYITLGYIRYDKAPTYAQRLQNPLAIKVTDYAFSPIKAH